MRRFAALASISLMRRGGLQRPSFPDLSQFDLQSNLMLEQYLNRIAWQLFTLHVANTEGIAYSTAEKKVRPFDREAVEAPPRFMELAKAFQEVQIAEARDLHTQISPP